MSGVCVVVGTTNIARRVCGTLASHGTQVIHLAEPDEEDLRHAAARQPAAVAIVVHDDIASLRYALAIAHLLPGVRLVVSVFDQTVAEQLRLVMPGCVIASAADTAVPTLAAACLGDGLLAVWATPHGAAAVRPAGDGYAVTDFAVGRRLRWRTRLGRLRGQLRPHDSGSRLLLLGLAGIAVVLCADWVWLQRHVDGVTAFFDAVRVVATVGPADATNSSFAYKVFTALAMLATIVFTAMFTAGVVHRAMNGRPFGLIGKRTPPVDGHVVVVGLGQVGLRLCLALNRLGISVVAVERNPAADNLRIAKLSRIPVLVAHGSDRRVLARLKLHRATALAAVGSDERDNIAVALTALAVAPGVRVIMRAGDSEAIAETRSLFRIAEIRDVTALSATHVILAMRRMEPAHLCSDGLRVYAHLASDGFVDCTSEVAAACGHG